MYTDNFCFILLLKTVLKIHYTDIITYSLNNTKFLILYTQILNTQK